MLVPTASTVYLRCFPNRQDGACQVAPSRFGLKLGGVAGWQDSHNPTRMPSQAVAGSLSVFGGLLLYAGAALLLVAIVAAAAGRQGL